MNPMILYSPELDELVLYCGSYLVNNTPYGEFNKNMFDERVHGLIEAVNLYDYDWVFVGWY